MAKISDAFILCRNNASEDYIIGISYHASPNRVIVTYNKKGVYIYDVSICLAIMITRLTSIITFIIVKIISFSALPLNHGYGAIVPYYLISNASSFMTFEN